ALCRSARAVSSTPARATGHLLDVATEAPRLRAWRMCESPGSPSDDGLWLTSTRMSVSVASRPAIAVGHRSPRARVAIAVDASGDASTLEISMPCSLYTNPPWRLARATSV